MAVLENDPILVKKILDLPNQLLEFGCTSSRDAKTMNKNIFHIIADYKSAEMFRTIVENKNVTSAKIKRYLNSGLMDSSFLSPLFYCYPDKDFAKMYMEYGANGSQLSLTKCYREYKDNLKYLDFAIA